MTQALTYHFDTTRPAKNAARILFAGCAIVFASTALNIYMVLSKGKDAGTLLILRELALPSVLLVALVVSYGCIYRKLGGVIGTITSQEVSVKRLRILGFATQGPEGTFPMSSFSALRLTHVLSRKENYNHLSLIGKEGIPDIFLDTRRSDEGLAIARQLAALISLPLEEAERRSKGIKRVGVN